MLLDVQISQKFQLVQLGNWFYVLAYVLNIQMNVSGLNNIFLFHGNERWHIVRFEASMKKL